MLPNFAEYAGVSTWCSHKPYLAKAFFLQIFLNKNIGGGGLNYGLVETIKSFLVCCAF